MLLLRVITYGILILFVSSKEPKEQEADNELKSRTGFPSPREFQKVTSPLLMTSSLSGRLVPQDAALRALAQSFVTFVTPVKRESCTLRQFISLYREDSDVYLDGVIIDAFKALLPLPSLLNCPVITDNLLNTRMVWRRSDDADMSIPVSGSEHHSLHCLLDGRGKVTLPKVGNLEISSKVKPGDCIYLPPKQAISWNLQDRIILLVLDWDLGAVQKCALNNNDGDGAPTLAHFSFHNDPSSDFFRLISLSTISSFIDDYHLSTNCTEEVFLKRFQKAQLKKDLSEWDEECQDIAKELFRDMNTDKDTVLSTADLEPLNFEAIQMLSGLLEDRLADIADIAEDQEEEKIKKKKGAATLANDMKLDYEKELQAILENGFNEILEEANIQGRVAFDKNGNPQVVKGKTGKKDFEETPETPLEENTDEIEIIMDIKDEL